MHGTTWGRIGLVVWVAACPDATKPPASSATPDPVAPEDDTTTIEPPSTPGDTDAPYEPPAFPPEPSLEAVCPYAADADAIATCDDGGFGALVAGTGFPTLADAVAAAGSGGVVTVCPGIWPGGLVLSEPITLDAADPTPNATVLDGADATTVLTLADGSTVRGLTIWRGSGYTGGIDAGDGATIECATFLENAASGYGADGGAIASGDIVVRWSTFEANEADYEGGAMAVDGAATIEDSVFFGNQAVQNGGAIAIVGDLTITGSTFEANVADHSGGALTTGGFSDDTIEIEGTIFRDNTAYYAGGAADIGSWGQHTATFTACVFEGNSAANGGGALALGSWGSIVAEVVDCDFWGNTATSGAAIALDGALDDPSTVTIGSSSFEANDSSLFGGFLNVDSNSGTVAITASDLVVHRNSAKIAALEVPATTTFDCTGCDFGAGVDDNLPRDAAKDGVFTDSLPADFSL